MADIDAIPFLCDESLGAPKKRGRRQSNMEPTNSLERLIGLLDVFSEERLEWSFDDLMATLGYSRPTLYRYIKILKSYGFLASSGSAHYTLGPRIVELDYLVRRSDAVVLHGAPFLRALTERHRCTALVVRWYGNKILCVASESSNDRLVSSYPRGRPMPLGRGAIARSILAFLPRAQMLRLIALNIEDLKAVGAGETSEDIARNLMRIHRTGYAVAYGEVTPGAVGIAAPIFDAERHPMASLCVVIVGDLVNGALIDSIGTEVKAAADEITRLIHELS